VSDDTLDSSIDDEQLTMGIDPWERNWMKLTIALLVGFFAAVTVAGFAAGFQLPGDEGRVVQVSPQHVQHHQGLAVTDRLGGCAVASAEVTLGMIEAAAGRPEARDRLEQASSLGLKIGNRSLQARAWLALSDVETESGAAREAVGRVLKLCQGSGLVHLQVLALTRKAELGLAEGLAAEADEASGQALTMLRRQGNVQGSEERVLMARAAVLEALGQPEAGAVLVNEAGGIVRSKAERIADPALRGRFLEFPANAAILARQPPG